MGERLSYVAVEVAFKGTFKPASERASSARLSKRYADADGVSSRSAAKVSSERAPAEAAERTTERTAAERYSFPRRRLQCRGKVGARNISASHLSSMNTWGGL